eukprot:c5625_g1_i1 orf=2-157(-)
MLGEEAGGLREIPTLLVRKLEPQSSSSPWQWRLPPLLQAPTTSAAPWLLPPL